MPSSSSTIGICVAKRPDAPKVTSVPSGLEAISECITETRFSSLCLGIYMESLGYILTQPARCPTHSRFCNELICLVR